MKYLPLVWAALTRKPARAILTLLAMTVAFMLVGLTIGMRATVERTMEMARMDRLYVNPRFGGYMPVAMGRQIAGRPGVREVQPIGEVWGYYQDRKNNVDIEFGDMRHTRSEWPITPAQWDELGHNPTDIIMSRLQAQRWHKKVGDTFTIKAPAFTRIDGTTTWTFKVLAVSDEMLLWPDGYIFGNFLYWDKSRALADQGKAEYFEMLANDPEQSDAIARGIDAAYASSGTPTRSITEKGGLLMGQDNGLNIGEVTLKIALAGLVMILFLTANGIAQSVRERFAEFAALKTMGYSDPLVMLLVFLEAALPCVAGAVLGLGLAAALGREVARISPPGWTLPVPVMAPQVYLFAGAGAAAIALLSTAWPALQLRRMDLATALSVRG
jgi:putative ABC transport system permease protein